MTTSGADFGPRRPVGSFLATTRGVLLSPARFFAAVRGHGAPSRPVPYAVACVAIFVLLAQGSRLAAVAARGDLPDVAALGATGLAGALRFTTLVLVLSPLLALVGLFLSAAVYHLLVRLLVGRGNGGYEVTVRLVAYLSAIQLLQWVPLLGPLAGLWGVWMTTVGVRELHSAATARAVLVAGIPYALSTAWTAFVVAGPATLPEVLLSTGGFFPGA